MRDFAVIGGIFSVALAIGILLFFFGPPSLRSDVNSALVSAPAVGTTTTPFTVIDQGMKAVSITNRTNYRITTASDLAALWPLVYGTNPPPIPTIDFSKYEVLAVFDGSHKTTGYTIGVSSIIDADPTRTVTILHAVPGPTCHPTVTSVSPFEIVQVPENTFTLTHLDKTSTTTCP